MELNISVGNGVNIFVNVINPSGNKKIVFLHGWPANYELFEYQYNILPEMGYCCIGIDQRGFGNSSKPWNGYCYNRLADDLFQVFKKMNLKNVTLLGHSTAGAIAIRYISRYKSFGVSKLVLCAAAAPSLISLPDFPQGQNIEIVNNIINNTYKDRPQMLRDFGNIFFHKRVSQPLSDWLFNMGLNAASWSTIAISKDWLVEKTFDDMKKIKVPTLIMHGIHDQVCPFTLGQAQNSLIKNSVLIPFENSGHGLFYDEIEKFNNELSIFAG